MPSKPSSPPVRSPHRVPDPQHDPSLLRLRELREARRSPAYREEQVALARTAARALLALAETDMTTEAGIRTALIHQSQYRALRHLLSDEFWLEVERVVAPGIGRPHGLDLDTLGEGGQDLDYQDSYRAVEPEADAPESVQAEE